MRLALALLALFVCLCGYALPAPTATPVATATPVPTATPLPSVTPLATACPPQDIEAEEYAVYSALIRQNAIGYDLGSFIVIRQQTVFDADMFERTLEQRPDLPAKLADSYQSRNAAPNTLGPNLDVEQDYALMPEEEFEEIFLQVGQGAAIWPDFEARYPEASGLVIFSRVGFDARVERALALMGYRCPGLCGAGGLYLLGKEDGDWKVQEELYAWQS